MRQLPALYSRDEVVTGGNFNALSKTCGYRLSKTWGRNLEESAEGEDDILVNDRLYPTRLG
ncbi:hypothetical protein HPB48_001324 [Haemaphysalis longicornis]|uniref:Uncharacterized protein n=1 Tax=Haemaphysalis longicornis TaxID=44386 RepID=A0A9J6GEE0_HAELO|nr:hypothetical protein HPB48_001324 [Haemaphysalis longicornis]